MKQVFMLTLIVLLCSSAWAQSAPAQTPTPQQPPAKAAPMRHHMHQQMMQHHMPDMKAQVETMRAKIADLKTNLAKVKDPATKQALQADLDLWESMAGHMETMQKMLPPGGPEPMAMRHDGDACPCCAEMMKQDGTGMACCGGNKCRQNKPGTPAAPENPAPAN